VRPWLVISGGESDEDGIRPGGTSDSALIRPLRLGYSLVYRLTAFESLAHAVPVSDSFFAELPAEQHGLAIDYTGKVEQADIEIFHLHADGIDLGDCVLYALDCLLALGFAPGQVDNVEESAAVEEDAVYDLLQFGFNGIDQFLAINRVLQQGFKYRQQGLSFLERKRTVGHRRYVRILIHFSALC
jgi:hypothetical protein